MSWMSKPFGTRAALFGAFTPLALVGAYGRAHAARAAGPRK